MSLSLNATCAWRSQTQPRTGGKMSCRLASVTRHPRLCGARLRGARLPGSLLIAAALLIPASGVEARGARTLTPPGSAPAAVPARTARPSKTAAKPSKVAKGATAAPARTGLENLEGQVKEFTLPNGLDFIVVERHTAPVLSFQTVVNAGSANDAVGTTGLAH